MKRNIMKPTYILQGVNDYKKEVISVPIVFCLIYAGEKGGCYLHNKKWKRKKCNGCKTFNIECIFGCCCLDNQNNVIPKVNEEEKNTS